MPNDVQNFLATSTRKALTEFLTALENLPEEKRSWSPTSNTRSAVDQAAEIAMLNGTTAEIIASKTWPEDYSMDAYFQEKAALATDWAKTKALLEENTAKVIAAIQDVPDSDLGISIQMPWGPMTMPEIMAYPYWNMTYHLGQTNYITFQQEG